MQFWFSNIFFARSLWIPFVFYSNADYANVFLITFHPTMEHSLMSPITHLDHIMCHE